MDGFHRLWHTVNRRLLLVSAVISLLIGPVQFPWYWRDPWAIFMVAFVALVIYVILEEIIRFVSDHRDGG